MGSSRPESVPSCPPGAPPATPGRWDGTLGFLLAATFAIRAIHPYQPIVENYVGRQVPTAMVARNLERGSGFLRPELDTGPFPNLFLVEPPIYAKVVATLRPILGLGLDSTGRLVSAAATTLGAWGLFGLALRREGRTVALLALGSFGAFPVMVRYGRAFQPDALMLGFVLAGMRGWDAFEATGDRRSAFLGGLGLATGLALKVTAAWVLIPFVLLVRRWPVGWRISAAGAMLAPAVAWYLYAWGSVARPGEGSLASADNAAIWWRSLDPSAWVRFATWSSVGWSLTVRSFTPIGFGLAILGWFGQKWLRWEVDRRLGRAGQDPPRATPAGRSGGASPTRQEETPTLVGDDWPGPASSPRSAGRTLLGEVPGGPLGSFRRTGPDRLWVGWGVGCGLAVVALAAKWHHAYYWMVVAPVVAVGMARGLASLAELGRSGRIASAALGSFFLALCVAQSASTWRTPPEWGDVTGAARAVRAAVPADAALIAPEALLYLADRRGYRLEFEPAAVRRAAGELGEVLPDADRPLALVELYHSYGRPVLPAGTPASRYDDFHKEVPYGARFVADVGFVSRGDRRAAWRAAVRARPGAVVRVDRPGVFVAELD